MILIQTDVGACHEGSNNATDTFPEGTEVTNSIKVKKFFSLATLANLTYTFGLTTLKVLATGLYVQYCDGEWILKWI